MAVPESARPTRRGAGAGAGGGGGGQRTHQPPLAGQSEAARGQPQGGGGDRPLVGVIERLAARRVNVPIVHLLLCSPLSAARNCRYLTLCVFPTALFLAERLYAEQPTGQSHQLVNCKSHLPSTSVENHTFDN